MNNLLFSAFNLIGQVYKILQPKQRIYFIFIGFSILITAMLDLIGTGVLLPILLLMLDEKAVLNNPYMSEFYYFMGFGSIRECVFFMCFGILGFTVFRMFINTYLFYLQQKRLYAISSFLSIKLYEYYYSKGYLYIKRHNSQSLINNVNGISSFLIQGYLVPFSQLICEIIVILSILWGLFWFNPYVFLLVILTFLPITLIYYTVVRNRIRRYGRALFALTPIRSMLLLQTFIGYTDMEMNNLFPEISARLREALRTQNRLNVRNSLATSSLQKILEIAIVSSIAVLIIVSYIYPLPSLGLIIGLFGVAVYRILPGLNRSTNYFFTMRGNSFAREFINELRGPQDEQDGTTNYIAKKTKQIAFEHTISIRNLDFSYGEELTIFKDFSLEIKKGDFIGFRGQSGSGKSTLFHLLLGFLQPSSGGIYIDDIMLSPANISSWRRKIGYVSQQLFMLEGTLRDNIVMGAGKIDLDRLDYVLRLSSLDTFVQSLPEGLDTLVGEGGGRLSGGQRQRIGIARALYKEVEILMFDEATSALDEETEDAVNQSIVRLAEACPGLTLLVISHRPASLSVCRKIVSLTPLT